LRRRQGRPAGLMLTQRQFPPRQAVAGINTVGDECISAGAHEYRAIPVKAETRELTGLRHQLVGIRIRRQLANCIQLLLVLGEIQIEKRLAIDRPVGADIAARPRSSASGSAGHPNSPSTSARVALPVEESARAWGGAAGSAISRRGFHYSGALRLASAKPCAAATHPPSSRRMSHACHPDRRLIPHTVPNPPGFDTVRARAAS